MAYLNYDLQLFAKEGNGGEKTEEPTSKRLKDARKKGQVAKSTDITSAISLLVFFCVLKIYVGLMGNMLLENFQLFYKDLAADAAAFNMQLICTRLGWGIQRIIIIILPFLVLSFVVTVIVQLYQVKWKVTFEPMKPQFNKFNPVSGMKRLFSKEKLVQLAMSIAKIAIIFAVVYNYLGDKWNLVLDMYHFSLTQAIALIGTTVIDVCIRISAFFLVIGFVDYLYQKWKFHEDMKMTKQEVKDEYKQAEGDPKVKAQQRRRMQEASQRRMMQALPQADVVITNPTHLAVALKYDKDKYDAPIVVAKGADYLAEKIKNVARENGIEIVENKPLARMLYHNVELGQQIPPELYQMVAEVLAYVYNLKHNNAAM